MDTSVTIIGLSMLFVFVAPVVYLIRKQSQGKRLLLKELKNLKQGNEIQIDEQESWKDKVIGLDRENGKVLLLTKLGKGKNIDICDLHQYNRCEVDKKISAESTPQTLDNQIYSKISLRFVNRVKGLPDQVFNIYNDETDFPLHAELRIAEEWAERLNTIIRKLMKTTKAA